MLVDQKGTQKISCQCNFILNFYFQDDDKPKNVPILYLHSKRLPKI
jgi:hypothetical protein